MKKYIYITMLIAFCWEFSTSCRKYLDAKPNAKLAVPETISQLQGILDNANYMNNRYSEAGEAASDNYYVTDNDFSSWPLYAKNLYIWGSQSFKPLGTNDWEMLYVVVYNANVVLDQIAYIPKNSSNAIKWSNCKGSALLYRALAFFQIAQIWTKAYDGTTAEKDMGIPLRLSSDFNIPSRRANIKDTYNQIIKDLKSSVPLLPESPVFPYRPSKPAAYGLLARTYLAMRDYHEALVYADSCLKLHNQLLDFNDLDTDLSYPFSTMQFANPEDIMHTTTLQSYNLYLSYSKIDTVLYQSYNQNDLRKKVYFNLNVNGSYYFRGSYDGSATNYCGIATDEIILTRAECRARQGDIAGAVNDLNTLLSKRWKKGTFKAIIEDKPTKILDLILEERRKELVNRMLRFTDIKRLNKENADITLKRIIGGQLFSLAPNDPRYALPIPDNVINNSNIKQN